MTPEERAAAALAGVRDDVLGRRLAPDVVEDLKQAVAGAIRAAALAERERCARICYQVQREADERHSRSCDPGEGSDGALTAAERITDPR